MKKLVIIVGALLALAGAVSCGGDRAVPRPQAFARIEPYDSLYHALDSVPVYFAVNDSAVPVPDKRKAPDGSRWVTLRYPRYGGARLYLTFTPATPATVGEICLNRMERMSLNAGTGTTEVVELTSEGGYVCRLFTTPSGTVTPLQILAVSPRMVVSGALFLEDAAGQSSPDSLAPIVDAVGRDLLHALKTLR